MGKLFSGLGWGCYLIGLLLFQSDDQAVIELAILSFFIGMICHWKFWIVGIAAFLVGANWSNVTGQAYLRD